MNTLEKTREYVLKSLNVPYDEANKRAKDNELKHYKPIHNDLFYKNKIFDPSDDIDVLKNLKVELEFVENSHQHDLWETFRVTTSSIACNKNIGRNIRILVKDQVSTKYLGILSLASDIATYSPRDLHIGWSASDRFEKKKLNYVMNINCCVGLQPIAHNYNIGKLLVAICYSTEVHDYIYKKYGHHIACITTFSINGKSIQYDRMKPYLELVGYTKGWGTVGISDDVYQKCVNLLKQSCDIRALTRPSKFFKIRKAFDILGIDHNLLNHGRQRGVYIGFVGKNCKEFLCDTIQSFDQSIIKPLDEIVSWWKTRWAIPRFTHLKTEGRLIFKKVMLKYMNLYNIEKTKKSIEKKKKQIGEDEYKKQMREYMQKYRDDKGFKHVEVDNSMFTNLNNLHPGYIAGLFDGDGSVYYGNNIVVVSISQCDPKVLLHLKNQFGGNIEKHIRDGKQRTIYRWRLHGTACIVFLTLIRDHVIIESEKVHRFLKGLLLENNQETQLTFQEATQLTKHGNDTKPYDRVNLEYIAGFFDAEGDVDFSIKPKADVMNYNLTITQKLDRTLLEAICNKLGYGKLDSVRLNIYKKADCSNFIEKVKQLTVVKKTQLELALRVLNTNEKDGKRALISEIVEIKHTSHDLHESSFSNDKKNVQPKMISQEQRKLLKQRMTGENNPNYGVTRSEIHATKIAMGQKLSEKTRARRKVTDEQIHEIRDMYKEGKKMQDIGTLYNVSHQYISNIIQGKLQTKDEIIATGPHISNSKLYTTETRQMKKNKLMLKVIQYYHENTNRKFTHIERDSFDLFGVELKCSKFKHWIYGSVRIPEAHFPIDNVSYEEYLQFLKSTS